MPNPFYDAQASAGVDPSQGDVPTGPGPAFPGVAQGQPAGGGAPYANIEQGVPPTHNFDEIGQIRDSILGQFPDLMAPDEPPMEMDTTQKLTLFGLFLANPKGAMDMIRERRERQAKRDALRAEMGLKATGVAGELLKAQNDVSRTVLEMHLKANQDWRERKEAEFKEHIERGRLALLQAQEGRNARVEADNRQFRDQLMGDLTGGADPAATSSYGEVPQGQSVVPPGGAPASPLSGMRRSITMGPGGTSVNLSDPSGGAGGRDPRVDFDGWLRGYIARFPGGVLPQHLSPDSPEGYQNLVGIWQKERGSLAPGTFGAAGGAPAPHTPGPVRSSPASPGYDDLSGDAIEAYGGR